ncbi:MAG: hypothetical protein HY791_32180 [Deltaproteobacteria bacterium]|nr:hypothetical protein [Deltaproteobacteria bacterium]
MTQLVLPRFLLKGLLACSLVSCGVGVEELGRPDAASLDVTDLGTVHDDAAEHEDSSVSEPDAAPPDVTTALPDADSPDVTLPDALAQVPCGNGVVDPGEACDDGNAVTEPCAYGRTDCQVCAADCTIRSGAVSFCGDGSIDSTALEDCDDANRETEECVYGLVSCFVCTDGCRLRPGAASYCGDSTIQAAEGEACDDGNVDDGDGCSSQCASESVIPAHSIRARSLRASLSCANVGFGVGDADWTFEFWIRVHHEFSTPETWGPYPDGRLFTQNEEYAAYSINPLLENQGRIRSYTYNDTAGLHNVEHQTPRVDDGRWHHYALVREGPDARSYLDGRLVGHQSPVAPQLEATSPMAIGAPSGYPGQYSAPVELGSIRYSRGVRYRQSFVSSTRWVVDAETIAQYLTDRDFDGRVLVDEAGEDNDCVHRGGWFDAVCGDGITDGGEACDDGNQQTEACSYGIASCAVCSANCSIVPGRTSSCGDGFVQAAGDEQCDDGNTSTEACDYGEPSCLVCNSACRVTAGATSFCGDGHVQAGHGEGCDDGNVTTESCAYGQTSCSVCGPACSLVSGVPSFCGDWTLQPTAGEQCDDGNAVTEACAYGQAGCTVCSATCRAIPGATVYCGDGQPQVSFGEQCDDGNVQTEACAYGLLACTVCSETCRSVPGATSFCGDGHTQSPQEQCDDGNVQTETCAYGQRTCTVCSGLCRVAAGATRFCGDGVTQSLDGEQCDDGNTQTESCAYGSLACSVCSSACRTAPGATAFCGDGVTQSFGGETCDDANQVDGDGCSTCQLEAIQPIWSIRSTRLDASLSCANGGFGVGGADWTFEFWIRVHHDFATPQSWGPYPDGRLFTQNEEYSAYSINPMLEGGGRIRSYTYNTSSGSDNIEHQTPSIDDDRWHHYALVREGANARTYLDGTLVYTQPGISPDIRALSPMSIGAPSGYSSHYAAPVYIGGVRYSSGVRYSGNFVPAVAWIIDAQTIAQYLTQAGFGGATLIDEAGGDNNCVHRRGWVPSP